jgi:polyphosphate kinase
MGKGYSEKMTEPTEAPSTPAAPQPAAPDLHDPALFINRELSWLEFNRRCLNQALDPDLPLLERVRFLSIFSNNLDEFFMVRVSGIKEQVAQGVTDTPADGLTPAEQLAEIRTRALPMMHEQRRVFHNELVPKLAESGIDILRHEQLSGEQQQALRQYFENEVFPVLTPLAVDPGRPFPFISNLSLNLAVLMQERNGNQLFARIKVPTGVLSRLIPVHEILPRYGVTPDNARLQFIFLEDLINANLDVLFPGMTVLASSTFRITRDTDMDITEEEASDLLETIEEGVRLRRFGQVVRMTIVDTVPESILTLLTQHLQLSANDVYTMQAPLGMNELSELANIDVPTLKFPPYQPVIPPNLLVEEDIFSVIRKGDILLHHPYESFVPTIEFFEQAARDPSVLAIKTTLYRTGSKSPIVSALLEAQENGKQVAVLVELKARFDEENNIVWARALESQGVHVVYGLMGLKVHSKISLVVRREAEGVRRYVHLSTGNYNAGTARIYTDLAMFTCRDDIASDATELFNRLTGYATNTRYRKLFVAPEHLRPKIAALIEREIQHARAGQPAHLIFKMNSLVDPKMIRLLYEASVAGVKVDLQVRGICCLRPGIPGVSENISVRALIGRFLEHGRIYYFKNGGHEEIYLGSADLMPRNLDSRVETVFPVETATLKRRIMDEILATEMSDNYKAEWLGSDGSYHPIRAAEGQVTLNAQSHFMARARER